MKRADSDGIKFIQKWARDPESFVTEAIRVERITKQQKEGLSEVKKLVGARLKKIHGEELTQEDQQYLKKIGISVMSGHGTGKDGFCAWLIIWFLVCFPYPKVPCTAPTGHQLRDVLWGEINKWMRHSATENEKIQSGLDITKLLTWNSERVYWTELGGKEWFATARTANPKATDEAQAETLAGRHEDYMMVVVDEACHDDQTEVLTDIGWVHFSVFAKYGAKAFRVLTLDPNTGYADYQFPEKVHVSKRSDEMYHISHRSADVLVTPNHDMLYWHKSRNRRKWKVNRIKDINSHKIFMPRTFKWNGKEKADFYLPGYKWGNGKREEKVIEMDIWLSFLGWYFSEGSINKGGHSPFSSVVISQTNKENREKIKSVLEGLGFKYSEHGNDFKISSKQLGVWLSKFGVGAPNKFIPQFIADLSPRQIGIFLDSFHSGDGYWKSGKRIFYTSSKLMADDLQELILKYGRYASVGKRKLKGTKTWIKDHFATSNYDGYVISEYKGNTHCSVKRENIKRENYDGMVYCLTVSNRHFLMTRRNGHCVWSGNSGVEAPVFKPIEGGLTGVCNFIVMVYNPTRSAGFAIDSQTKDRSRWAALRWNSEESELVSREIIEHMENKYGRDSNPFRIRVLGLPPKSEDDVLIPWEWVMDAIDRDLEPLDVDQDVIGFDVGAGSDPSIILNRHGPKVLSPIHKNDTSDSETLTGWAIGKIMDYEPSIVFIDRIGVGWGIEGNLRSRTNVRVIGVNVAEVPSISERFYRLRDELWWKVRELFEKRAISIPNDDELIGELSIIKYSEPDGKIKVESKKDLKRRGVASPNKADALCLTEYYSTETMRRLSSPSRSYKRNQAGVNWKTV